MRNRWSNQMYGFPSSRSSSRAITHVTPAGFPQDGHGWATGLGCHINTSTQEGHLPACHPGLPELIHRWRWSVALLAASDHWESLQDLLKNNLLILYAGYGFYEVYQMILIYMDLVSVFISSEGWWIVSSLTLQGLVQPQTARIIDTWGLMMPLARTHTQPLVLYI